jgi:hypothetical protein
MVTSILSLISLANENDGSIDIGIKLIVRATAIMKAIANVIAITKAIATARAITEETALAKTIIKVTAIVIVRSIAKPYQ